MNGSYNTENLKRERDELRDKIEGITIYAKNLIRERDEWRIYAESVKKVTWGTPLEHTKIFYKDEIIDDDSWSIETTC